jgi:hypothetical protein
VESVFPARPSSTSTRKHPLSSDDEANKNRKKDAHELIPKILQPTPRRLSLFRVPSPHMEWFREKQMGEFNRERKFELVECSPKKSRLINAKCEGCQWMRRMRNAQRIMSKSSPKKKQRRRRETMAATSLTPTAQS